MKLINYQENNYYFQAVFIDFVASGGSRKKRAESDSDPDTEQIWSSNIMPLILFIALITRGHTTAQQLALLLTARTFTGLSVASAQVFIWYLTGD